MPRELELMPYFLDQIGKNSPELNFNLAQFTKDLAGGLISKFYQFQNVFKPEAYQTKKQREGERHQDHLDAKKDRHDLIKDLHFCSDACYPSLAKPREEIELDNFAKAVISIVN